MGIANKLGYISVVEELKVVTETNITTTTTVNIEEKYKVVAPEAMQETFMSDSEDEGGRNCSFLFIIIDYKCRVACFFGSILVLRAYRLKIFLFYNNKRDTSFVTNES